MKVYSEAKFLNIVAGIILFSAVFIIFLKYNANNFEEKQRIFIEQIEN